MERRVGRVLNEALGLPVPGGGTPQPRLVRHLPCDRRPAAARPCRGARPRPLRSPSTTAANPRT
jgi:hypothetical protein